MSVAGRNVISARWLIMEAFTLLLAVLPLEKISVHAIVHKAGISRSTFYSHFQDKFDLLEQVTEEITSKLLDIYEGKTSEEHVRIMESYTDQIPIPATFVICEHIRSYESFYRNRFHDPHFLSWLNEKLRERLQLIYGNEAQATFAAGGTVGFIGRWLLNGLPGTSLENALQLSKLATFSLSEGHITNRQ
ncbi:TetR family transcriptional regulator [Paenibacillus sp. YIM B09110]|uniref:TetR family transcriptional regulator n=1 Tax=Paenibacillus sp. YIM B09110 TaxID=3126102 RepID=UPI00301B9ABD